MGLRLHRYPLRHPRLLLLFVCAASLQSVSLFLAVFYALTAPNWDVPFYAFAAVLLALIPVGLLMRPVFGYRTLQVEHAGVVMTDYLFGWRLSRRVWPADTMRHFDWEEADAEGYRTLRLLIQPHPAARPFFRTVLLTDNDYLLAAVWRDLHLHYPGSGLREEPPVTATHASSHHRVAGALLITLSLLLLAGTGEMLWRPLYLCAYGQVSPAVVQQVLWDSSRPGSTYHLRCLPLGSETPCTDMTAYSQDASIPREGARCELLWAEGTDAACRPNAVSVFLFPLLLAWLLLIPLVSGVWCCLMRRRLL